jgi:hypothetical protein
MAISLAAINSGYLQNLESTEKKTASAKAAPAP